MSEYLLSDDGQVRIVARDADPADAQAIGNDIANAVNYALPDGFFNTTSQSAWATLTVQAINGSGIALTVHVNGGGMAGCLLATQSTTNAGQMVLHAAVYHYDRAVVEPALLALAIGMCAGMGKTLVQGVTVYEPVIVPQGGGGGPAEED